MYEGILHTYTCKKMYLCTINGKRFSFYTFLMV